MPETKEETLLPVANEELEAMELVAVRYVPVLAEALDDVELTGLLEPKDREQTNGIGDQVPGNENSLMFDDERRLANTAGAGS